jgi:hypothetical protein
MAGMPKRRARKESIALKELSEQSKLLKQEKQMDKSNSQYSEILADEIVMLIAEGHPIDDGKIGDITVCLGISSKIGVSSRTIYRWLRDHPEFKEKVREAREESSHRFVDMVRAYCAVAMDKPNMAQSVRVACENLWKMAAARNRPEYGDSRRIDLNVNTGDLGERLRRAKERVVEGEQVRLTGTPTTIDAEIVEGVTVQ